MSQLCSPGSQAFIAFTHDYYDALGLSLPKTPSVKLGKMNAAIVQGACVGSGEWSSRGGPSRLQRRTTYKYDKLDRRILETRDDDGVELASAAGANEDNVYQYYDAAGNLTRVSQNPDVDPRQIAAEYLYDAVGRVVAQTDSGVVSGVPEERTTRFQYDAVGNQSTVTDPLLRISRSEYDRLDRLIKQIDPDPDGAGAEIAHATTFTYDAAGQLLSEANGAGNTDTFAYDAQGRLVRSTDGRGDVTLRRYDGAGNLAQLTDPAGNSTSYQVDGLDRVTHETDQSGKVRKNIYNSAGDLEVTVDRNGRGVRHIYDRLHRKSFERWYATEAGAAAGNDPNWSDLVGYHYDDLGRLEEQQYWHKPGGNYRVTASYAYDGLDRLAERSNQSGQSSVWHTTGAPALTQTYAYGYDAGGLVETREQFVGGAFAAQTKSHYNAFGELTSRLTEDGNSAGPSPILDFNPVEASFTYLADGQLSGAVRRAGWSDALHRYTTKLETAYSYDAAGRLQEIAHGVWELPLGLFEELVDFAYGYNSADRIGTQGTDWNQSVTGLATRGDTLTNFTYDAAGQLTVANEIGGPNDASYGYGPNGNRTSATELIGGTDAYTPGAQNRVSQDSTYDYQYDLEGNLTRRTSRTDANDYETYGWDHRNRLTKVEEYVDAALAETVDYRYNAANELIYRSVDPAGTPPAVVEHYALEGGERTITLSAAGKATRRTERGPLGEVLFDQAFNSLGQETDTLLPVADHQNSTRLVLGSYDQSVRQSLDYAQFGRVTAIRDASGTLMVDGQGAPNLSAIVTVHTHHGSVLDVATGQQNKSRRWYSPDLGRFVSEDPAGFIDGSNLYAFVGNNPIIYVDPSGLYRQGHPLEGGSRAFDNSIRNLVNNPVRTVAPTSTFGGFATPGAATLSSAYDTRAFQGPVSTPQTRSPSIGDFNAALGKSNNASALTRTDNLNAPLRRNPHNPIQQWENEQRTEAFSRVVGMELQDIGNRQWAYDGSSKQRATLAADATTGLTPGVSDARDVYEVATGRDLISREPITGWRYGCVRSANHGGADSRQFAGVTADGVSLPLGGRGGQLSQVGRHPGLGEALSQVVFGR